MTQPTGTGAWSIERRPLAATHLTARAVIRAASVGRLDERSMAKADNARHLPFAVMVAPDHQELCDTFAITARRPAKAMFPFLGSP